LGRKVVERRGFIPRLTPIVITRMSPVTLADSPAISRRAIKRRDELSCAKTAGFAKFAVESRLDLALEFISESLETNKERERERERQ